MNGIIACFAVAYGPATIVAIATFWLVFSNKSRRNDSSHPQSNMRLANALKRKT